MKFRASPTGLAYDEKYYKSAIKSITGHKKTPIVEGIDLVMFPKQTSLLQRSFKFEQ